MVIDPDGVVWRRAYDQRGNLIWVTDPLAATTSYAYDEQGHIATVTDALGHVRRVQTNGAGLPTTVTDPLGGTTQYTRDSFGRVSAIIDPVGGVTRFGWTLEGKLAWRTLPDGASERWRYDGEGNLVEHVDAVGQVTRTEIAHFDLPAAKIGPDGARLEFSYDTELRLVAVATVLKTTPRDRGGPHTGPLRALHPWSDCADAGDTTGSLIPRHVAGGMEIHYGRRIAADGPSVRTPVLRRSYRSPGRETQVPYAALAGCPCGRGSQGRDPILAWQ